MVDMKDLRLFSCQNCRAVFSEDQMLPLPEKGVLERVAPGEPMPYGECPRCQAVAHPFVLKIGTGQQKAFDMINEVLLKESARCTDSKTDRHILAASIVLHLSDQELL